MNRQEAIQKAFKNGFDPKKYGVDLIVKDGETFVSGRRIDTNMEKAFLLDPSFWQAFTLGMGWDVKEGEFMRCENYNPKYNEPGERGCNADKCPYAGYRDWKELWHSLIDHLAEGKSTEDYFTKLN